MEKYNQEAAEQIAVLTMDFLKRTRGEIRGEMAGPLNRNLEEAAMYVDQYAQMPADRDAMIQLNSLRRRYPEEAGVVKEVLINKATTDVHKAAWKLLEGTMEIYDHHLASKAKEKV